MRASTRMDTIVASRSSRAYTLARAANAADFGDNGISHCINSWFDEADMNS
jgi:hypothetical protein